MVANDIDVKKQVSDARIESRSEALQQIERLSEAFSLEEAMRLVRSHPKEDFDAAEKLLSEFKFPYTPTEGVELTREMIATLNLAKKYSAIKQGDNSWSHGACNVAELESMLNIVGAKKTELEGKGVAVHGSAPDWYFFRDRILSPTQTLLEKYGVKASLGPQALVMRGLVYMEEKHFPDTSREEFLGRIMDTFGTQEKLNHWDIPTEFKDWKTALSFLEITASKPDAISYSTLARQYQQFGFVDEESVRKADVGQVIFVAETFGELGVKYIAKDATKFQELAEKAKIPQAGKYFEALQGNMELLNFTLSAENKPTPEAVSYVVNNFPRHFETPEKMLEAAREVSKHSSDERLLWEKTASVKEFKDLAQRWKVAKEKYVTATGKGKDYFFRSDMDLVESYKGDLRFFREFATPLDSDEEKDPKRAREAKYLELITAKLTFEEYEEMGKHLDISYGYGKEIVGPLMAAGYVVEEVKSILAASEDGNHIKKVVEHLKGKKIDCSRVQAAVFSEADPHHFFHYEKYLGDEPKMPPAMATALSKHNIGVGPLEQFLGVMPAANYWSGEEGKRSFGAVEFLSDYRVFHNLDQNKEKRE